MEVYMNDPRGRILIIDDELAPREAIKMVLKDHFEVCTASSAIEGLDFINKNQVDIVIMDIKMPKMDGITALQKIKTVAPDTEVVLLTAYASIETARDAVRFGAFDYLIKPFDKNDILNVVRNGIEKKKAKESMKLEQEILRDRTNYLEEQVAKARQTIMSCYEGTIRALIHTIDAKDHYTYNHSNRVAQLSASIARVMGLPERSVMEVEHGASIHDIGKIGIVENILNKQGKLSEDEYEEIKKHPSIGCRIVKSIPFLEGAIPVILYHHERYDGTGYPCGLKGEHIPLNARIVMVADAIDAMLSVRPYRRALSVDQVMGELDKNSGTQFDPSIVDIVLNGRISIQIQ